MKEQPIVLIVDDDKELQSWWKTPFHAAIRQSLASAEEAVTLLQGRQIKYRALVLDISLRGRMNGWEAARKAKANRS